ncbi:MAG: hypothetical protein KGH65_00115 [Candidatus Micrarchaeota archaeon]|nr:hypothetical protein [Candidatus Micrarchaeota archaeon]
MHYFDITNSPTAFGKDLGKRLGFRKLLNISDDVELVESLSSQPKKPFLIVSQNPNVVYNLIKSRWAIGLLVNGDEPDQKVLNKIKENGKLLVLNSYYLTIGERDRVSKVQKLKKIFRNAHKGKTKATIISLAPNANYLLSFMQLLEIAKMITTDEHQAKVMLGSLGESINDIEEKE